MKQLLVLGALALALTANAAGAQRSRRGSGTYELGIDGGITRGLDVPNNTVISLPATALRLGYFWNKRVEIEPRISLTRTSNSTGTSRSVYTLEAGLVYQRRGDRVGNGLYFRPFLGVDGVSATSAKGVSTGSSTRYAGGGIGVKLPFQDRRLATRLEGNYARRFDTAGTKGISLLFGLSWFTR